MKTYNDLEQKRIIAENLQELISRSGKDQKDVAFDLELNPPTFNQWVTGKATPQVSTLRKVANYFKVPFSYLINDHADLDDEDKSLEVLPPDIAMKYYELDENSKLLINSYIDYEYEKHTRKVKAYLKAINLDKIESIDDAKALIGESVAFDGMATDKEIIQLANEVLKFKKKKAKK